MSHPYFQHIGDPALHTQPEEECPGCTVIHQRMPPDTRLVLFNIEGMRTLAGEGRVEWGEPTPEGWYVPTFYVDPRLEALKREVTVLEGELAELAASVLKMKPRYMAMQAVTDWVVMSHANFPEHHDHHCAQRGGDTSESCTCGWADAGPALKALIDGSLSS